MGINSRQQMGNNRNEMEIKGCLLRLYLPCHKHKPFTKSYADITIETFNRKVINKQFSWVPVHPFQKKKTSLWKNDFNLNPLYCLHGFSRCHTRTKTDPLWSVVQDLLDHLNTRHRCDNLMHPIISPILTQVNRLPWCECTTLHYVCFFTPTTPGKQIQCITSQDII